MFANISIHFSRIDRVPVSFAIVILEQFLSRDIAALFDDPRQSFVSQGDVVFNAFLTHKSKTDRIA